MILTNFFGKFRLGRGSEEKLVIFCLFMVFMPLLTHAQSAPMVGSYVGIQAGLGGMGTPDFSRDTKNYINKFNGEYSQRNSWGFSGRLFAGHLWYADKFIYGLELGAMTYSDNKYSFFIHVPIDPYSLVTVKIRYEGYLIDLLGVKKYQLIPTWNFFAKEGASYTHQKVTAVAVADDPATGHQEAHSKKDINHRILPKVVVGIGYRLMSNAELNLSYNHVFGEKLNLSHERTASEVASVDAVMIGIAYVF